MTGLVITTYNRPDLLAQCFESLYRLSIKPDMLIIVDDGSDQETITIISAFLFLFKLPKGQKILVRKDTNAGIKDSLKIGFEMAFNAGCDVVINLDGDAIVRANFIEVLVSLKKQFPNNIVSGFNCDNPKNPVLGSGVDFVERKHSNGINFCLSKEQYERIVLPALNSNSNWDFDSTNKLGFIISKPSVVQHIGAHNSTMGHAGGDVACDFKLLNLPDVTLFGIDAHDPQGIIKAGRISQENVEFGAVKIITERLFSGREAYSRFCIKDMVKYVETSHVLIIHSDGYLLNPLAWQDEWLQYDYIGAKWWYKDARNVGNGGFSLRSRKLLEMLSKMDLKEYHPEDHIICRELHDTLEKKGIKFAPDTVADKFSLEAVSGNRVYTGQFGFHGYNIDFSSLPYDQRPYHPEKAKTQYPALEAFKKKYPIGGIRNWNSK